MDQPVQGGFVLEGPGRAKLPPLSPVRPDTAYAASLSPPVSQQGSVPRPRSPVEDPHSATTCPPPAAVCGRFCCGPPASGAAGHGCVRRARGVTGRGGLHDRRHRGRRQAPRHRRRRRHLRFRRVVLPTPSPSSPAISRSNPHRLTSSQTRLFSAATPASPAATGPSTVPPASSRSISDN